MSKPEYVIVIFQNNTILYISISVISNIHRAMNLYYPYCYTLIYMLLFLNSLILRDDKILGANCPPPCSYGHTSGQ